MLDRLVNGVDRGIRALSEAFAGPVHSYCRLETVDNGVLVADDGSLVSLLHLEGSLKHVGVEEYTAIVSGLTEKLQATLSKPGHAIQTLFEYDPENSGERIAELLQPSRLTAHNLGLHIGPLLEDWGHALQRFCALEKCWIALWTRPAVLPGSLRKTALKERDATMSTMPTLTGCQQIARAVAALHDAHNGFLTGVLDAFRQADLLAYPLTAHEALRDIRLCIAPEFTSRAWRAIVPGDPLPLRPPDPDTGKREVLHNVIYPDFRTQLWPREGNTVSRSAIRIGERIYGPLIMTLMPQTPKPFQDFFRVLARREERLPYRMSFLLEDGGLNMGLKPLLAAILAFTNADNKRLNNAVEALRAGFGRRVLRQIPHLPLHMGLCSGKRTGGSPSAQTAGCGTCQSCSGMGNVRCDGSSGRSAARCYRNPARHDAGQPGSGHSRAASGGYRHVAVASGFAVERGEPSLPYPGR